MAFDDAAAAPQPQVDRLAIATSSGENSFVILMRADPKPVEDFTFAVAEDAVGLVHPCTPHLAEMLQAQRWMEWVLAEEFELLIGLPLNIRRKGAVKLPEFVRGLGVRWSPGLRQTVKTLFAVR